MKLFIVDDDENIRGGLRHLIDWDELGIEITGEAEGGNEAFEKMKPSPPHIVLTDISMPQGDGLELIEAIHSCGWETRVIVLSGFNDYEFVRKAMRFDVEDYLLKPVDKDELLEIIKTICEQYHRKWLRQQLERESFHYLRNNILIRWIENRIEPEPLREKLDFLELYAWKAPLFQIASISWKDMQEGSLTTSEERFRPFAILNVIDELMRLETKGLAFLDNEQRVICLFVGEPHPCASASFAQDNLRWLTHKAQEIALLLKVPWFSTLGNVYSHYSMVYQSYRDSLQLIDYMNLTGPVTCIDHAWREQMALLQIPSFTERINIIQDLLTGQHDRWIAELDADFQWALSQENPLAVAKALASEWIVLIRQTTKEIKSPLFTPITDTRTISKLLNLPTIYEIKDNLQQILKLLEQKLNAMSHHKSHSVIDEIESLIREHLQQELSLKTLAVQYNISSVYLGKLFKQETGEYFSDYLNRVRIDQAKVLLSASHNKVYEIAALTGFIDPTYFIRKFKKMTGVSPIEYRNLHK